MTDALREASQAVPPGMALVPIEPTEAMIEAARDVKRQRLLKAVEESKAGRHPNTIGMAMACAEEWAAMLAAAQPPAAQPESALPVLATGAQPTRADLVAALKFYANGEHLVLSDQDAWDTVSGEPQNWQCDEAGTATVEDGSIAKMVLAGELTAAQIEEIEDGEVFAPPHAAHTEAKD